LSLDFTITVDSEKFKKSLDQVGVQFHAAFATALNMVASLIKQRSDADIRAGGKFGDDIAGSLNVTVSGNEIKTTFDDPRGALFEHGGTIHGNPLLWIPISGTDAEGVRASSYGAKLFSVNRKAGGVPLLFSVADHAPKYFGVPSVNIPKKFHLAEIQTDVMADFANIFKQALGANKNG